jgi:hypothetical protein
VSATIPQDRWTAVRASVRQAGDRFAALVRSAPDPLVMATAHWTIADMAAHVATTARMYRSLIPPGDPAALMELVADTTVDTLADLNERMLRSLPERDPGMLVDRISADIDDILVATAEQDPATPVPWLGGAKIPLAGALAHLQNELLLHGRDIALPLRVPWVIAPAHAALFFDLFIVGVIRYDVGAFLDNDERPRERRVAVKFRSAYTDPVTIVLHWGQVSVEEPGGRTDIRVSFDPETLLLMLFHRISQTRAVLSGKVRIRGLRPWLLPGFLRTVRAP